MISFLHAGLCVSTVAAVNTPHDRVSALEFIPTPGNTPVLAVGTQQGRVLAVPVEGDNHEPLVSVSHRYVHVCRVQVLMYVLSQCVYIHVSGFQSSRMLIVHSSSPVDMTAAVK